MTEIRMSIVNVAGDLYIFNLIEELDKQFKTLFPVLKTNVEIYLMFVQNVDQLQEEVISTDYLNRTDIILILGLSSMKNDITKRIIKVREDTEDAIGRLFAKIPTLLCPMHNMSVSLNSTCLNNTLIFIVTGNNDNHISNYIQVTANSIILSAHLLQLTIKYYMPNIFNHPGMEKDKILYTHHGGSLSPLNLSLPKQTVSTNQKTPQSTVSVECALSIIRETLMKHNFMPESEFVHITNAYRRILSQPITNITNVPPYAFSKINPLKFNSDARSQVDEEEHISLEATAVTSTENVNFYNEAELLIKSKSHSMKYGQNVKFPGSDIERGKLSINKFTRIGLNEIALLATCGHTCVAVFKKLSIGILIIESESEKLGKSYEHPYVCNRENLILLLRENNFYCKIFDCRIANIYDVKDTKQKIETALEIVDLLVTTGYNKNNLKIILKSLIKATLHFENVDIKPGKSTAFASCSINRKPKIILCLPGNPASFFMTAHVFLLPLVKCIHKNFEKDTISAKLEQKLLLHSRPRYVWTTLSWNKEEHFVKVTCKKRNTIHNNLSEIIGANALLRLPSTTSENSVLKVPLSVPANFLL